MKVIVFEAEVPLFERMKDPPVDVVNDDDMGRLMVVEVEEVLVVMKSMRGFHFTSMSILPLKMVD